MHAQKLQLNNNNKSELSGSHELCGQFPPLICSKMAFSPQCLAKTTSELSGGWCWRVFAGTQFYTSPTWTEGPAREWRPQCSPNRYKLTQTLPAIRTNMPKQKLCQTITDMVFTRLTTVDPRVISTPVNWRISQPKHDPGR